MGEFPKLIFVASLVVVVAACGAEPSARLAGPTPNVVPGLSAESLSTLTESIDEEFVRLAKEIPGFGGLFFDADGKPNVYLKAGVDTEQALSKLQVSLEAKHGARFSDLATRAVVLQGQYSFDELAIWYGQLRHLQGVGVIMTDIDERQNAIVIGVLDSTTADGIRQRVIALGIPIEAVVVKQIPPAVMEETLRDAVRPVPGGVQIQSSVGTCTLGLNLRRYVYDEEWEQYVWDGQQHFVTASHCLPDFGVVSGASVGQPNTSTPIGVEVHDPPLFSGGDCPEGRLCRRSDATVVRYNTGVSWNFGSVANPSVGLTIGGYYAVSGWDGVFVGDNVFKVGRTTGETEGSVTGTCIDFAQFEALPGGGFRDTGRTMLCQYQASYGSDGGDSGAAVLWVFDFDGTIRFVGIHWGSGGIFALPMPELWSSSPDRWLN